MSISTLIQRIAEGWSEYRDLGTVSKEEQVYSLVVKELPAALRAHVADFTSIILEGSTGQGNITASPWVGLFDARLTTSATREFYVVYLFSTDLSTVTLSLAFGTTQFEEQFRSPSAAFPKMRQAAQRLQNMFEHLLPAQMNREQIELGAISRQRLHYAYQQSTILAFPPYRLTELPSDDELIADLRQIVAIYAQIVNDPLEVRVSKLVETVVDPEDLIVGELEASEFQIRAPRKRMTGSSDSGNGRRYSEESRKVGDAGERAVFEYERRRLIKLGRQDWAEKVRWHAQASEYVGWDITSFDDLGEEIFIEVKSSVGRKVLGVTITANEWAAACNPGRRDRYYIYIVTNALSAVPQIERMKNPAAFVAEGRLLCEPAAFELQLTGRGVPGADPEEEGLMSAVQETDGLLVG